MLNSSETLSKKNCMNCSSLLPCKDPKKGVLHICKLHKYAPSADLLWKPSLEKIQKQQGSANSAFTYEAKAPNELDLVSMLDNIYDSRNQVMRDLRVDDHDFKEFPNLYEFAFRKEGLNAPLFSRQFYACLTLMHEICTTCSNPKYVKHIKDVPLDLEAKDFPEHFQLMEYGVCPKCGKTKNDHFQAHTMNPYNELAGLAGQRVGKSLITACLGAYLTHKVLKLQDPSKVYGLLNTTLVGTFVALTYNAAHEQLWLPYKNFIESSEWFCIAEGTLVELADGSTKAIEQVAVGDEVRTLEGASPVVKTYDNGVQECKEIVLENDATLVATDAHKVRCLSEDGLSVVWKLVSELTDEDYVLTS